MNVKILPKAEYEMIMKCPNCGWHGDNNEDVSAILHERIEEKETIRGAVYYHCTCCDTDFKA